MSVVYLDDLDLMPADGRWRFSVAEGIDDVPEVRGDSLVVPFRRGRVRRERTPDKRKITLNGYVKDPDLRGAVDELKSVLSPVDAERVLRVDDPLGIANTRWTSVVVQNVIAQVRSRTLRTYSIELEADPFWYEDHDVVTLTPATTNQTFTVDAGGSADVTDVRVELDGASTSAVGVKNDVTGVGFTHPALAAAAALVVDSGERVVTLNNANARANLSLLTDNSNGEYLRLGPGNNTVRVSGKPAAVRLIFDSVWL